MSNKYFKVSLTLLLSYLLFSAVELVLVLLFNVEQSNLFLFVYVFTSFALLVINYIFAYKKKNLIHINVVGVLSLFGAMSVMFCLLGRLAYYDVCAVDEPYYIMCKALETAEYVYDLICFVMIVVNIIFSVRKKKL